MNHRRFCHQLGQSLPGAGYAENETELAALLAPGPTASVERSWLFKRALGYAGRGRKKCRAGEVDRAWIDASLRTGDGLQVEPWVERLMDFALHGWIAEDGTFTLGSPTVQVIDSGGAWVSTAVASNELEASERELLSGAARETAVALHASGYFGPFGIDSFRWRDPDQMIRFQPRCEINARYSMGWAIGMGSFRAE